MNDHLPHLLVFGTRTFDNFELLCDRLDHFTSQLGKLVVIHGDADGADALADRWADERKHTRMIFYADWDEYGKAAGPLRNQEMIAYILPKQNRFAIAFWNGKSKGTADMIQRCRDSKVPLRIVRFK